MEMHSGLPVGVAAFVGRERERARLAELIADARVVTLSGSGGCGKTRLAVEIARDVASWFPHGACWVDLQGVSEPAMVAPVVAGAVGVHERPGQALSDTLAEQLRVQQLLVVLDNCEHLLEACATLVAGLTSACPQLHVLATSRVPLAVEGEATFEVAPLPVPSPDTGSASTVAAADAARLFEVRARHVAADFRVGDDNAAAVGEICRRLDGIPLTIELAAARVRVLAPDQIAAGLSDRFGLLTGGVRGAPARQQTLEASLDWSYQLLDEAQRLALARLSVFAGSFELDAAAEVVADGGIARGEVLDLVAGLVEQSMVEVVEREGRARYRLLETIRVYARRRLSELDDPERVRDRHLAFHIELAGRAQAGLTGGHPEPWAARLTAGLDDLRAAMDGAAASGDLRGLVDLTEPIVRFLYDRGLSGEMHRRLHDAAEGPGVTHGERVRGLTTAALLALGSDPISAYRSANQAVQAAQAARGGNVGGALALGLSVRAQAGFVSGLAASEQVDADVEEAISHAEQCEDAATHAWVLSLTGWTLLRSRAIDAGCHLLEQAIEVSETAEVVFQLPATHGVMGLWSVWSGQLDGMRGHARRTIELSRQVGRPGWEAIGLAGLGAADVLQGDHGRAQERLSDAHAVLRTRSLWGSIYDMWSRPWLVVSALAAGDLDTAQAAAAELVQISRRSGSRWDEAVGEWLLGMVADGQQRLDDARAHLESCCALSIDPRLPFTFGRSALGLAELAQVDEELTEAWELAHDGLESLADYGDRVGAAATLETIAALATAFDEPNRSLRLLAASERFRIETGIVRLPLQADRFDRARNRARAALRPGDARTSWEEGSQLSLADAIAYARRGRGERRRPQIGWASLTPTEHEVVQLVAQGHTNAQVGECLFISTNTVKKHLTHIYAKLEVDGRAGLAGEAARRNLSYHP